MTAICVGGVTLVIVPLLSLTANLMSRISRASCARMAVSAVHLDETSHHDLVTKVIPKLDGLSPETTESIFLLCSPQYLASNRDFRDAVLRGNSRGILRLVAVDEAHLYAQHGRTFRESICVLSNLFFQPLFWGGGDNCPLFLAMTATMTERLLRNFSKLTHVDWLLKEHQLWSTPTEFRQRNIVMDLHVGDQVKNCGLVEVVKVMKQESNARACVFVNFRSEAIKWSGVLEGLLSDELMRTAVLQINGDMDKSEKFAFIRLFVAAIKKGKFNPRVLVATAAANTGIDAPNLIWVLRVGIPRCLITLLQERGRNARELHTTGMYVVLTDWTIFAYLVLSILKNPPAGEGDEIHDHFFVNSMIGSQTPEKRRATAESQRKEKEKSPTAPLSEANKAENVRIALDDLIDTLHLLFLPAHGCIHLRCETILSTGKNDLPGKYHQTYEPCGSQCYVCNKKYEKYTLPIVYEGTIEFLGSSHFGKTLRDKTISYDEPEAT